MHLYFNSLLVAVLLFVSSPQHSQRIKKACHISLASFLKPDSCKVSLSYTELKDGNGNVYGKRYTLTNNDGKSTRVNWSFSTHENCIASGGFEGVEDLIGYGYSVITTVTQLDRAKPWKVEGWSMRCK